MARRSKSIAMSILCFNILFIYPYSGPSRTLREGAVWYPGSCEAMLYIGIVFHRKHIEPCRTHVFIYVHTNTVRRERVEELYKCQVHREIFAIEYAYFFCNTMGLTCVAAAQSTLFFGPEINFYPKQSIIVFNKLYISSSCCWLLLLLEETRSSYFRDENPATPPPSRVPSLWLHTDLRCPDWTQYGLIVRSPFVTKTNPALCSFPRPPRPCWIGFSQNRLLSPSPTVSNIFCYSSADVNGDFSYSNGFNEVG